MQYHFVVVYDENTDGWDIDIDTAMSVFTNGVAFDTDSQEWFETDELMQADYEDYESMLAGKLRG
jgi:hypothetical protein